MRLSIFTPTNNFQYLLEAYDSIKDQPYDEWVILQNGEVMGAELPSEIANDPRTVVVSYLHVGGKANVGELKKAACLKATGDILLELDHDDILLPGAIAKVKEAFENNPGASMVYSRFAEFNNEDRSARKFGIGYGWEYDKFAWDGMELNSPRNPAPTPYHASIIYFAPNHLRAFRKTMYEAAGGHNVNLAVLDDQDLMCRLYTRGSFVEIPEVLYLYRVHGENTWLERNAEIQANTAMLRRRYLHAMVEAWAVREKETMLDLGGQFSKPKLYTSVDLEGGDVIADLTKPYPFPDSSVAVVRAFDFLEHVEDKMHSLSEIHRILKPGGYLLSLTPSTTGPNGEAGMGADQDPTHVSRWNRNSFWYVTRAQQAQYIKNTTVRFHPAVLENLFPSQWHQDNIIPYTRADLVCLKQGYRPHGFVEI